MKKLVFLLGILAFTVGMSYGQNVVDVDQSVGSSNADVDQDGANLDIQIEQIGLSADSETGFVNDAWATQTGSNSLTDVYQNASTYNYAYVDQSTSGSGSDIIADQTAADGDNYLWVHQRYMYDNKIDLTQTAGTYNHAELLQGYTDNSMLINQSAATYNEADVKTHRSGVDQYLYGADADGNILTGEAAIQISTDSYNYLYVRQRQADYIGLHQEASGENYADIYQYHTNSLGAYQVSANGRNILNTDQPSGIANLVQDANNDNVADVYQSGGAVLAGADDDGAINTDKAATQNSTGLYNVLYTDQSGGNNDIGLFQSAVSYNFADIDQFNGNNSLGIHQTNTSGFNSVDATQSGDQTATVIQNTTSGDGVINVNQGP